MKRLSLFLMVLVVATGPAFAQEYVLSIKYEAQTAANVFEFDIYLQKTGATWADYSWGQFVITFNTAIVRPGGVLYFTVVPDSSELTTISQIPVQSKLSISGNELRVAAGTPPGSGSGSPISMSSPGTRICRFRLVSTSLAGGLGSPVSFAAETPNLAWKTALPNPYSQICGYVSGVSTTLPQGTFNGPLTNASLPVELTSFRARYDGKDVELHWSTAMESSNAGFEVERRGPTDAGWRSRGFVQGAGSSSTPHDYAFTDTPLPAPGDVLYRLKQIDRDGTCEYSSVVSVRIDGPKDFVLAPNHPNPFVHTTTIAFNLPEAGATSVRVYDVNGRLVRTLNDGPLQAGYNSMVFDAAGLHPGVYRYVVSAGSMMRTGALTIVK